MRLTEVEINFIRNNVPPPFNTPERVDEYILPRIQIHDALCTTVKAEVIKLIDPLIKKHYYRFFCRVDDTQQQKSAISIVDKIRRSNGKYDIDNFSSKMTDLARFRIVCNFRSDVKKVADIIMNSNILRSKFKIEMNQTIDLRPKKRISGERSTQFVLEYLSNPGLYLEIQVMTMLEEAWDKKDHFLVYESLRRYPDIEEIFFPDYLDAKMFAMSELLYVADNYFDELRASREDENQIEEAQ